MLNSTQVDITDGTKYYCLKLAYYSTGVINVSGGNTPVSDYLDECASGDYCNYLKCDNDTPALTLCGAAAYTNDEMREYARVNCPTSATFSMETATQARAFPNQNDAASAILFTRSNAFVPYKQLQIADTSLDYCLGPLTQESGIYNTGSTSPTDDDILECPATSWCNYIKCTGNDEQASEVIKYFTNCSTSEMTTAQVQALVNNTSPGAEKHCNNIAFKRHYFLDKNKSKGSQFNANNLMPRVVYDSGFEFLIQSSLIDPELDVSHANIHRNNYIADYIINRTIYNAQEQKLRKGCRDNCVNGACNDQAVCICQYKWKGEYCDTEIANKDLDVVMWDAGWTEGGYIFYIGLVLVFLIGFPLIGLIIGTLIGGNC